MNLRERRQARREILSRAWKYARDGKSVDELQADMLDEVEQQDGDIGMLIQLFITLLPLIMEIFSWFRK